MDSLLAPVTSTDDAPSGVSLIAFYALSRPIRSTVDHGGRNGAWGASRLGRTASQASQEPAGLMNNLIKAKTAGVVFLDCGPGYPPASHFLSAINATHAFWWRLVLHGQVEGVP